MTHTTTVRLDDKTHNELAQLAKLRQHKTKTAAIAEAIHLAYQQAQAEALEAAYTAAVADNPHYPYETADERTTLRKRRNLRQATA